MTQETALYTALSSELRLVHTDPKMLLNALELCIDVPLNILESMRVVLNGLLHFTQVLALPNADNCIIFCTCWVFVKSRDPGNLPGYDTPCTRISSGWKIVFLVLLVSD